MAPLVPLAYTCGNFWLSTVCCFSCGHFYNWAEMACVALCPFLSYIDDEAFEDYGDSQSVLYHRALNFRLCYWGPGRERSSCNDTGAPGAPGWKPATPCAHAFSLMCRVVCGDGEGDEEGCCSAKADSDYDAAAIAAALDRGGFETQTCAEAEPNTEQPSQSRRFSLV